MGPNPFPISTKHASARVPWGWTLGRGGSGEVFSRGRGSPTCCLPALPRAAGALPVLWRGLPVAYPNQRLSAPHGWLRCARERRSFSDLFRERAGCLQELKLLCKEQRRRAEAGRRPRGRPHRGTAAGVAGHRAKWRWDFRCGVAHLSGPGARICPRRAALWGLSIQARGGSFAGSGGSHSRSSRRPSSAPTAPQPSLLRLGAGDAREAAARPRGVAGQGRAGYCSVARKPAAMESSEGN